MNIKGKMLINGKYPPLDKVFERWWLFLNSLGVFSFTLALSIDGTRYMYLKSIACSAVVVWIWYIGKKTEFPVYLERLRKSRNLENQKLAKLIEMDYLHPLFLLIGYMPFLLGFGYLAGILLYPMYTKNFGLYFCP